MEKEIFEMYAKVLDDNMPLTDIKQRKEDVKQRKEMLNEIRKLMPPERNRWNIWYALLPLSITALALPLLFIAKVVATFFNLEIVIPEGLITLSSTAIGALVAFILPHQKGSNSTTQQTPTGAAGTPGATQQAPTDAAGTPGTTQQTPTGSAGTPDTTQQAPTGAAGTPGTVQQTPTGASGAPGTT